MLEQPYDRCAMYCLTSVLMAFLWHACYSRSHWTTDHATVHLTQCPGRKLAADGCFRFPCGIDADLSRHRAGAGTGAGIHLEHRRLRRPLPRPGASRTSCCGPGRFRSSATTSAKSPTTSRKAGSSPAPGSTSPPITSARSSTTFVSTTRTTCSP